jgi:hypothetical protein
MPPKAPIAMYSIAPTPNTSYLRLDSPNADQPQKLSQESVHPSPCTSRLAALWVLEQFVMSPQPSLCLSTSSCYGRCQGELLQLRIAAVPLRKWKSLKLVAEHAERVMRHRKLNDALRFSRELNALFLEPGRPGAAQETSISGSIRAKTRSISMLRCRRPKFGIQILVYHACRRPSWRHGPIWWKGEALSNAVRIQLRSLRLEPNVPGRLWRLRSSFALRCSFTGICWIGQG